MVDVGELIRLLRTRKGWTLRDLSERCNLSVSFLSQVERGLSSLSITSLAAVCQALGVSLADLFSTNGAGDGFSLSSEHAEIIKEAERPFIQISSASIKYQFLSGEFPERLFEILIGEIPPNYHYPPVAHDGEEFGYVLEGHFRLTIGEDSYELGPGDSYHFLATTPHGYWTDEQGGAKVLWVQTLKYSELPFSIRKQYISTAPTDESAKGVDDRDKRE